MEDLTFALRPLLSISELAWGVSLFGLYSILTFLVLFLTADKKYILPEDAPGNISHAPWELR